MKTELTIALETETLAEATRYAARLGQELPALLTDFVQQLARHKRPLPPLPPEIQALRGTVILDEGVDYRQITAEEIARKYGA